MYHNGCVHHIVFGDDLEWFPRTHHLGSLRQLLYRCTCCTCCTGTLGTAGTAAVQHTHIGQQLVYAVPAVPLYLLYRCTAVPAVPPGLSPRSPAISRNLASRHMVHAHAHARMHMHMHGGAASHWCGDVMVRAEGVARRLGLPAGWAVPCRARGRRGAAERYESPNQDGAQGGSRAVGMWGGAAMRVADLSKGMVSGGGWWDVLWWRAVRWAVQEAARSSGEV